MSASVVFLLCCCSVLLGVSAAVCHKDDRSGLLAFKAHITDDPSGLLATWKTTVDCCGWSGIECDPATGRVSTLDLRGKGLSGTIPSEIGSLAGLFNADLSQNKISGRIPKSIGRLSNLTYFYLANNKFTGKIPASYGTLDRLVILDHSSNNLSGPIPRQLSKLPNLRFIQLSFNPHLHRTSPPPSWLGGMGGLVQLELAGTGISGPLPSWLSSASSISVLDLSNNKLTGELPRWIRNMSSLSDLNLSNNALGSAIPDELGDIIQLGGVDLHSNRFTGSIRPALVKREVKVLDLSWNEFSGGIDADVFEQREMSDVRQLLLSHNRLTGPIPGSLLSLDKLVDLDVSYNRLTGSIPYHKFKFGAGNFTGNPGLCGEPLPPCKS